MKIPPSVPVIGPLLYRRSVRAIAGDTGNGDVRAVRILAGIVAGTSDAAVHKIAVAALCSLSSQEAIDAFCSEVLDLADPALESIALSHGYAPADPDQRALFLYLTGQEETLCRSDPDAHHPFLARGYAAAPPAIRTRAQRSARNTRMGDILARTLMGTDPARGAMTWSHGEWEVVMAHLTATGAWEDLWLLAISAPPSLAVAALHAMKTSGWRPEGDDRRVFDELVRNLPDAWSFPIPVKPLISIDNQDSRSLQLAFSRDGSLLATGNCDGRVAVWHISTARLLASVATTAGSIRFLAFTPDNTCLISGGDNGTLHCSGIPSGDTVWSYGDKDRRIISVVLSGTGEEIVAGDHRGGIVRVGCRTGKTLLEVPGHLSPVTALSPAPDQKTVAAGHADGTVCCRHYGTGKEMWTVPGTGDAVRALAFAGDADHLFVVHERSPRYSGTGKPESSSGHTPGTQVIRPAT